jgi:plasmid stabilization system protein ParE
MSFIIHEMPKAKLDKSSIFHWLHEHSPSGAAAWLDAYDGCVEQLRVNALTCGEAPESHNCDFQVRQILFKTPRGRVYRALYLVENEYVFILRVRGPGQAPVDPTDVT